MKTLESRLTQKGQVTIPAEIRAHLGLKPRDRVRFTLEDGDVRLTPALSRLLAGYGAVRPIKGLEDAQAAREAFEQGVAEEVMSEC